MWLFINRSRAQNAKKRILTEMPRDLQAHEEPWELGMTFKGNGFEEEIVVMKVNDSNQMEVGLMSL